MEFRVWQNVFKRRKANKTEMRIWEKIATNCGSNVRLGGRVTMRKVKHNRYITKKGEMCESTISNDFHSAYSSMQ